jgi:hypothetical protein
MCARVKRKKKDRIDKICGLMRYLVEVCVRRPPPVRAYRSTSATRVSFI